jgi:hypothetical protein
MERLELNNALPAEVTVWEAPEVKELGSVNDMTQWTGSVTVE